jgi:hypothetical protein
MYFFYYTHKIDLLKKVVVLYSILFFFRSFEKYFILYLKDSLFTLIISYERIFAKDKPTFTRN